MSYTGHCGCEWESATCRLYLGSAVCTYVYPVCLYKGGGGVVFRLSPDDTHRAQVCCIPSAMVSCVGQRRCFIRRALLCRHPKRRTTGLWICTRAPCLPGHLFPLCHSEADTVNAIVCGPVRCTSPGLHQRAGAGRNVPEAPTPVGGCVVGCGGGGGVAGPMGGRPLKTDFSRPKSRDEGSSAMMLEQVVMDMIPTMSEGQQQWESFLRDGSSSRPCYRGAFSRRPTRLAVWGDEQIFVGLEGLGNPLLRASDTCVTV